MATDGETSTKTATPQLRFPEFAGAGAWTVTALGNLFAERQETGFDDLPLLSLMDKEVIIPQAETNRKNNSNSDKSKYLRVMPGDIAYNTMRMWEGRSALVGIEGLVSPAYTVCAPSESSNSKFFAYFFRTEELIAQFRRYSQGLVKDTLNLKYEAFARIPIACPSPAEQQKIADCLSSLDDLIETQERQVAALVSHKQGLMQKLFPREGESRPHLRFPEFRQAGEWEARPLGKCFSHIRNGFVGTATPFYVEDGIAYLQGKNIKKGRIDPSGLIRISHAFNAKQTKSQLRSGDIVMVQSGHVGECALIDGPYVGANCHALIIMTPNEGSHSPFFVHSFGADYGIRLISQITTGNTIKHILASDMKAMVVHVPQPAEQQRIAACLSALDDRLVTASEKLAILRTHKKGLMQQLFLVDGD